MNPNSDPLEQSQLKGFLEKYPKLQLKYGNVVRTLTYSKYPAAVSTYNQALDEYNKALTTYLTNKLTDAVEKLGNEVNDETKEQIKTDLKKELTLTLFTPHPDLKKEEVTGKQELTFYIDTSATPPEFKVSNSLGNSRALPYDSKRIDRRLKLGQIDEWTLQSHLAGHPFHIHVNPFQIVAIYDPFGRDVTEEDDWAGDLKLKNMDLNTFDPKNNPGVVTIDPEYKGLKNVWRDTIWLKSPLDGEVWKALKDLPKSDPKKPKSQFYTIVMRTRYERFPGDFVLHCHILDHEDEGMMQNVSIVRE